MLVDYVRTLLDTDKVEREIFDVEEKDMNLKVYVKSKLKIYDVVVVNRAVLEREEFCASKFTFTVLKDDTVSFNQGDAVSVKYNGEGIFYGYVFRKKRDKNGIIEVWCYDQMRYLKNKCMYTRGSMTVGEIVRKIVENNALAGGEFDESSVKLLPVALTGVSMLDVIKKACSDTESLSGEKFIVYDDFGKLNLKNENNLSVELVIDATQAENFEYEDSIDKDVYNMIELYSDGKDGKAYLLCKTMDKEAMETWGTLALSKRATDDDRAKAEGRALLAKYNRVNRSIVITGIKGNKNFVPGSSVWVKMGMGDLAIDKYVRIKKAVHIFENNRYTVNIHLDGSDVE